VLEWAQSTWFNTPCSTFANFSDLRALPSAPLVIDVEVSPCSPSALPTTSAVLVNVTNTAPAAIAFLVHLRLIDAVSKADVWPAFWSDNYFSLLPGEVRGGLIVSYDAAAAPTGVAVVAETFNSVVSNNAAAGN
jgi:exo-1,4-beta-D-glucosaminidase